MDILILTTGSTIEGIDHTEIKTPSDQRTIGIHHFLKTANLKNGYTIEQVLQKDSRHITPADRMLLAEKIQSADTDKILITHGTFTMETTAAYLGNLNLGKTIVLVGSFLLGTDENTDAPFNLGYALGVLHYLEPDVYVAMHGSVFHWRNVTKNLDTDRFEKKR